MALVGPSKPVYEKSTMSKPPNLTFNLLHLESIHNALDLNLKLSYSDTFRQVLSKVSRILYSFD